MATPIKSSSEARSPIGTVVRRRAGMLLALTLIGIGLSGCVVYERPYPHYYEHPHYYYYR